ncbi:Chemotaxis regulator [Candidatus Rhodobacter oscarellae]|uniref:Chemotaxis regulator n=1 Tax=Candidatus Rhodobacter oscarellae TaxID=1675527 RepID=A0A0J9EG73_9RHOB|nr:response regulator [Candidatus Rhodobacter lobularis]KMW60664.1 Chemotaxis regulator [Candidatus Rhodobacter lobularis]
MSLREKLNVMVVDDMSVSRGLIIQGLEEIGIKNIEYSTDGESAFKKLAAKPVHLVISDYNMPGADGLQLLAGLRQYGATQRIGFILITGTADPAVIEKGNQLGMNNYIKKPFSAEQLKGCIERVVGPL